MSAKCPDKLVPHPRFKGKQERSNSSVTEQEIRESYWGYGGGVRIFPETALKADVSVQRYAVFPRPYYVDILKDCRDCGRPFIFYAREQRYWYETLGFYIDADCVHCPECRRRQQLAHRHLERYAELQRIQAPTRKQMTQLVDDSIYLFQHGLLKNASRLGQIKNAALKRVPNYAGTRTLQQLLAAHDCEIR